MKISLKLSIEELPTSWPVVRLAWKQRNDDMKKKKRRF